MPQSAAPFCFRPPPVITLLHTADWQIGKLFGQFEPEDAALLADARFATVDTLARLATEQGVDAVLVAGDVFDAQGVSERSIHRLFNTLAGYAGPWVMIPGNHDAGLAESVWTRAQRLGAIPANVHLCLSAAPLMLPGLAILPAPLTQRIAHADLTEWFAGADTPAELIRVGLAHGSVQGILADGIDSSNPIAAGRAESARLDYLALGDWHGTRRVDPRSWYAGTPETDRFRANDSGQALLVRIAGPGALPDVTPVATGRYRWLAERLDLQVPTDLHAALAHIDDYGPDHVVQLSISGQTDLSGRRCLEDALARASGKARCLAADLDALRLEPTDADLAGLAADGYLGDVIGELGAQLRDHPDGPAHDALALLAGFLADERGGAR